VQWFQRAADQEELRALYNLYSMYSSGWYTSGTGGEDRALALRYLQAAAVRGFAQAQCKLGVLYRVGRELPQDYAEAAKWYRRGADQGYAYSMHNLAEIYEKGLGVREDAREAAMWDGMFHQYKGLDVEYFLL
jgi:hypothetical protein